MTDRDGPDPTRIRPIVTTHIRSRVTHLALDPFDPGDVAHGELAAANALSHRIHAELGWCAVVPMHAERLMI